MRPRNIILSERLFVAGFVLALVADALDLPRLGLPAPPWLVVTVQAAIFALLVGLVLLVTRRRSRIAQWVLVILFLTGAPIAVHNASVAPARPSVWLVLLETALQGAAVGLLFTKPAQDWMVRR